MQTMDISEYSDSCLLLLPDRDQLLIGSYDEIATFSLSNGNVLDVSQVSGDPDPGIISVLVPSPDSQQLFAAFEYTSGSQGMNHCFVLKATKATTVSGWDDARRLYYPEGSESDVAAAA